MAFDFPASPTQGQQFSPSAGVSYVYNGYAWDLLSGPTAAVSPTNVRVFTTSQTYVPTAGMQFAIVEVVGGGGGGGGVGASTGISVGAGGGGAGGYSKRLLTAAQIGASQTITIGAGGAGGIGNAVGSTGGTTSFGALCIASPGAGGGGASTNAAGAGGSTAAAVGDVVGAGPPGGQGGVFAPFSAGGRHSAGHGGSSIFGGGGSAGQASTSSGIGNGSAAINYGSGGGGAQGNDNASTANGGAGSAGVCVVTEYGGSAPQAVTVPNIKVITASGTYTPSPGLVAAIVEVVGGGGSGGAAASQAGYSHQGGGGGGGGYSRRVLTAAQIGASQTITIGAGGVGGTGLGNPGGATSFGSLVIANGGGGAPYANPATNPNGGAGGSITGAVGDFVSPGGVGGWGCYSQSSTIYVEAGNGAAGPFGGGATTVIGNAGVNATGYGAGGSGGSSHSIGTVVNGGNGSAGVCIVTEFIQQGGAAAAALPGSRVLIQTQTVSAAVAQVDFITGIDSTYDEYEIHFFNWRPSVDAALSFRVSENAGSSWKGGASDYTYSFHYVNITAANPPVGISVSAGAVMQFSNASISGNAALTTSGKITFFQPSVSGVRKTFFGSLMTNNPSIGWSNYQGMGVVQVDTNIVNGIRFLLNTAGNFVSGTFNLYGIKK